MLFIPFSKDVLLIDKARDTRTLVTAELLNGFVVPNLYSEFYYYCFLQNSPERFDPTAQNWPKKLIHVLEMQVQSQVLLAELDFVFNLKCLFGFPDKCRGSSLH